MRKTRSDKILEFVINSMLVLITFITLYPLYFVLIASFSNPIDVASGKVVIWVSGFNLDGYEKIFQTNTLWTGYRNSIYYTLFGTLVQLGVTVPAAYALSRRDLVGRSIFMKFFTVTMFFNGGLIPTYIVVKSLNLVNKPIVLIILGAVNVYNMIVARTFFQSNIPEELREAAQIDGCGNARFFVQIALPLSKAILAVLVVFFAVGHWNDFFRALIYMGNREWIPLQLVLREILLSTARLSQEYISGAGMAAEDSVARTELLAESIKYGVIIVSSVPVLILYPFAQKYFVQGVMIGSIKG
jgi:putative aldouronate transport system permease protein